MRDIQAVFFDLDGTLADTAPDMIAALNRVLEENGRDPVALDELRLYVSHGSRELVRRAFNISEDHPKFSALRQRMVDHYAKKLCDGTKLFSGMHALLDVIEEKNIKWGVVTNKPGFLTNPLLELLGLKNRMSAIVSGDTVEHMKPHPAPLLHACELSNCAPENVLYVGDAERDVQAGNSAGTKTLIAMFGYISDEENPNEWGASGSVDTPEEIIHWL